MKCVNHASKYCLFWDQSQLFFSTEPNLWSETMIWYTKFAVCKLTFWSVIVLCRISWRIRIRNLLQSSVARKWNQTPLKQRLNLTPIQVLCLKSCNNQLWTSTNNWRARWRATIQPKPKRPTHFQLLKFRGSSLKSHRKFIDPKDEVTLFSPSVKSPNCICMNVIWSRFSLYNA